MLDRGSWSRDPSCRSAGSAQSRIRRAPAAPPAPASRTGRSVRRSDRFGSAAANCGALAGTPSARGRGSMTASGFDASSLDGLGLRRHRPAAAAPVISCPTTRIDFGACRPALPAWRRITAPDADPSAGRRHWRRSQTPLPLPPGSQCHPCATQRQTTARRRRPGRRRLRPLFSERPYALFRTAISFCLRASSNGVGALPRFFAGLVASQSSGSAIEIEVPLPSSLCTCMSPPCSATRPFTIDRPRPVPSWRRS